MPKNKSKSPRHTANTTGPVRSGANDRSSILGHLNKDIVVTEEMVAKFFNKMMVKFKKLDK
jgi:hypothetical protein